MVNYFDQSDRKAERGDAGGEPPRRRPVGDVARRIAGEAWALPNTILGLGYGYAGHAVGTLAHEVGLRERAPRVVRSHGKTDFVDNPFGGVSAITLGDTTTYNRDPYRGDYRYVEEKEGHTVFEHEGRHMEQARRLGIFYLPSNFLGGLNSVVRGEGWHGDSNWNERGPQLNPSRIWAPRNRR